MRVVNTHATLGRAVLPRPSVCVIIASGGRCVVEFYKAHYDWRSHDMNTNSRKLFRSHRVVDAVVSVLRAGGEWGRAFLTQHPHD